MNIWQKILLGIILNGEEAGTGQPNKIKKEILKSPFFFGYVHFKSTSLDQCDKFRWNTDSVSVRFSPVQELVQIRVQFGEVIWIESFHNDPEYD